MVQTVLITGATGQQGGSAITQLQKSSNQYKIRALVRDPNSSASKKLAEKGVELVKGDLLNAESLKSALTGVDSAFLMTYPLGKEGAEAEITQGKNFIGAAKATGLKFLVLTSVGSADRNTRVPHFDSKYEVEKYLQESGIKHTILRPTAFMDNFPMSGFGRFAAMGMFNTALAGKKLQMIAVEDIGIFAAKAIEQPDKYAGRAIELAGDETTADEMLDSYQRAQGVRPWRMYIPMFLINLALPHDFSQMFRFFREEGYVADIAAVRREHPDLQTFEEFIRRQSHAKSA